MHTLAVIKMNNPFGFNGHAARVLGGLFGQVEPSVVNENGYRFYIDPLLKHCFPSVEMVGGGVGLEVTKDEVVELSFPDKNFVTAMKQMLSLGLHHRWQSLYAAQLNQQRGSSMLVSMLEAERDKALNGLRAITQDEQGVERGRLDLLALYSRFNGEGFNPSRFKREAPSLLGDQLMIGLTPDSLNQHQLYDLAVNVPVIIPAPKAVSFIKRLSFNTAARDTENSHSTQVEEFKAVLASEDMLPLWSDSIAPIAMNQVNLFKSSLAHYDSDDDDYDEDDFEDVPFRPATQSLSQGQGE